MPKIQYLSAEEWAPIIAKAWVDNNFKEILEKDPREGIRQFYRDATRRQKLDKHYALDEGELPRLFFIPHNPNYSDKQLEGVLAGKRTVIPVPGMVIHGRRPQR